MSDDRITVEDIKAIRNCAAALLYQNVRANGRHEDKERFFGASRSPQDDIVVAARAGEVGGSAKIRNQALGACDVADKLEAKLAVVMA